MNFFGVLIILMSMMPVAECNSTSLAFNMNRLRSSFHMANMKKTYKRRMTRKTTLDRDDFQGLKMSVRKFWARRNNPKLIRKNNTKKQQSRPNRFRQIVKKRSKTYLLQ